MTQREKVLEKIKSEGFVDNFWALDNYILRLGAIIYQLSKEGMEFRRVFGKELGKDRPQWKNFYYIYQKPEPIIPPKVAEEKPVEQNKLL